MTHHHGWGMLTLHCTVNEGVIPCTSWRTVRLQMWLLRQPRTALRTLWVRPAGLTRSPPPAAWARRPARSAAACSAKPPRSRRASPVHRPFPVSQDTLADDMCACRDVQGHPLHGLMLSADSRVIYSFPHAA